LFVLVVSALASLLAALTDKYRLRALIPMTALAGLSIAFMTALAGGAYDLPNYGEALTPAYLLLWTPVWILLTLVAFLVTRGTSRDDAPVMGTNMAIRIWKAGVLSVLVLQFGFFTGAVFPDSTAQTAGDNISVQELPEDAPFDDTIVLSAADIPEGKATSLSMDEISYVEEDDIYYIHSIENPDTSLLKLRLNFSEDELTHFGGKQIVINIRYARNIVGGYDITDTRNQQFYAWIEGAALHIRYSYDTPKGVAILPKWDLFNLNIGLYDTETAFGIVDIHIEQNPRLVV
jgi:hypothetical protein